MGTVWALYGHCTGTVREQSSAYIGAHAEAEAEVRVLWALLCQLGAGRGGREARSWQCEVAVSTQQLLLFRA